MTLDRLKEIISNNIIIPVLNRVKTPNQDAIWIFGLQKSGTTAIANLLAHMSGSTVSIDPRCLWSPYGQELASGTLPMKEHAMRFSLPFSRDIIKEPSTTLYIDRVESYFFLNKYVFIVRNPYSNIRSILNRLDLPGDKTNINMKDVHINWRGIFKQGGRNYIFDLADFWLRANSQDHYLFNDRCRLIKYEDFKNDKENFIVDLCMNLDLPVTNSIKDIKNIQFQPKGNRSVNLKKFFGDTNLKIIEDNCGRRMNKLGYSKYKIL